MRADPDQKEFADWLCKVGNGSANEPGTLNLKLPAEAVAHSVKDLIDFCFEDLFKDALKNSDKIADAAILAPKNDIVQQINEEAMQMLSGEERPYTSLDKPLKNDVFSDHSVHACDQDIEAINNETPSGMPPHILKLKVIINFKITVIERIYKGWRPCHAHSQHRYSPRTMQRDQTPNPEDEFTHHHVQGLDRAQCRDDGMYFSDNNRARKGQEANVHEV